MLTFGLICISRVYSLEIEKDLLRLSIFQAYIPASWVFPVESKKGPSQRHSNAWTDMYYLSLLSLDIEKYFLRLSIF